MTVYKSCYITSCLNHLPSCLKATSPPPLTTSPHPLPSRPQVPGICGQGSECVVRNHQPICSCPRGYTGHPFESCRPFTPQVSILKHFINTHNNMTKK